MCRIICCSNAHLRFFLTLENSSMRLLFLCIMQDLEPNEKVINIPEEKRHGEHCRCFSDNGIHNQQYAAKSSLFKAKEICNLINFKLCF